MQMWCVSSFIYSRLPFIWRLPHIASNIGTERFKAKERLGLGGECFTHELMTGQNRQNSQQKCCITKPLTFTLSALVSPLHFFWTRGVAPWLISGIKVGPCTCAPACMQYACDCGVDGPFSFHPLAKRFTLAVAWKGGLIEKHSGHGICHPPCCSVTTLIHALPDQNQEASHSTSQREGDPLHSRGAGKEEERKGKHKDQTRPALINNPMNLQASVTQLLLFQ